MNDASAYADGSCLFQCDQIAGDVFRILRRKPEAGHHGHVLHLQSVTVVRAPAVLQVEDVGQALLLVILGPMSFFS